MTWVHATSRPGRSSRSSGTGTRPCRSRNGTSRGSSIPG
jgi:hypothetical protein